MAAINHEYGSRPIYTLSQAVAKYLFFDDSDDNSMPPENLGDKYTALDLFKAHAYLYVRDGDYTAEDVAACKDLTDIFMLYSNVGYSFMNHDFSIKDALSILEPSPKPAGLWAELYHGSINFNFDIGEYFQTYHLNPENAPHVTFINKDVSPEAWIETGLFTDTSRGALDPDAGCSFLAIDGSCQIDHFGDTYYISKLKGIDVTLTNLTPTGSGTYTFNYIWDTCAPTGKPSPIDQVVSKLNTFYNNVAPLPNGIFIVNDPDSSNPMPSSTINFTDSDVIELPMGGYTYTLNSGWNGLKHGGIV